MRVLASGPQGPAAPDDLATVPLGVGEEGGAHRGGVDLGLGLEPEPPSFQGRAGRNTLIGPSFRRTDLSLAKRFPVGGGTRFEFRADVYNLFNNVNFGQPAANISNTNVGTITEAADARSMQLGFRLIW